MWSSLILHRLANTVAHGNQILIRSLAFCVSLAVRPSALCCVVAGGDCLSDAVGVNCPSGQILLCSQILKEIIRAKQNERSIFSDAFPKVEHSYINSRDIKRDIIS